MCGQVWGRQTCEIHTEGKKIINLNSVWLLRAERTGELRTAGLIDLCRPLISLTGTWFIEMGFRVHQGYGSKHQDTPLPPPPLPHAEGHLELRSIDSADPHSHNPFSSHCLLINCSFRGWGVRWEMAVLVRRKRALKDKLSAVMRRGDVVCTHENLTRCTVVLIVQHGRYRHQIELLITLQHTGNLTNI